jgi:hypothetical protein
MLGVWGDPRTLAVQGIEALTEFATTISHRMHGWTKAQAWLQAAAEAVRLYGDTDAVPTTEQYGPQLRLVRPAFTSQTSSACGHRDPQSRPDCGRVFACTACGHQAHADRNAACNIERTAAGQGGQQHAQSSSGGEARTEPHA